VRSLGSLIRSNFFIILATFAAGYIAWRVYRNEKEDEKRDASNVIILEIERAETGLTQLSIDQPFFHQVEK
jgi:hypothetical protein